MTPQTYAKSQLIVRPTFGRDRSSPLEPDVELGDDLTMGADLRHEPRVVAFASATRQFVSLFGAAPNPPENFAEELFRSTKRLIETMAPLPNIEPGTTPNEAGLDVGEQEVRRIYDTASALPIEQFYDKVWDDGETVTADLADDVADIYRDLKPGMLAFDSGDDALVAGAVWSWRFSYQSHWKQHIDGLHGQLLGHLRQPGWKGVPLAEGENEFVEALLAAHPEWERLLSRIPDTQPDTWTINLEVPSPTGDSGRCIAIWLEGGEPSVAFGGNWHTHARSLAEFWQHVEAILADELVLAVDVGGEYDGFEDVLDFRDQDAAIERLTEKYSGDPWGLLFMSGEYMSMGMDSQWYVSLEDAFRESSAWEGENPPGYEVS